MQFRKGSKTALTMLVMSCLALPAWAQSKPTIRIIGPTGGATKALVDNLIPEFEKRTGIKVQAGLSAYESMTQKTMTEFVAGSPTFDVLMFETGWGGRYAPFLVELKSYVDRDTAEYKPEDILAAAKNMGMYEGKTVGLPYRVAGRMLHYRRDLFEQAGISSPPKTFAEFTEAAKKLTKDTDGDGKPDVYGVGILGKQGFGNAYEFGSFLFSSGGSWWDLKSCKVNFGNDVGVRTLQYYSDLALKEKVVPPEASTWAWDEIIAAGQRGRYAMTVMHVMYAVPLNDPKASATAGKWAWADAPGWDGPEQAAPPVGGWLFGIPTATKNKDAAWQFIKFVTGPEGQLISALNGNAPGRKSTYDNEKFRELWPWADVGLRSLSRGTPMYNNPEEMEAESALMVRVSEALLGTKDPKTVATEGAAQLQEILKNSGRCK